MSTEKTEVARGRAGKMEGVAGEWQEEGWRKGWGWGAVFTTEKLKKEKNPPGLNFGMGEGKTRSLPWKGRGYQRRDQPQLRHS